MTTTTVRVDEKKKNYGFLPHHDRTIGFAVKVFTDRKTDGRFRNTVLNKYNIIRNALHTNNRFGFRGTINTDRKTRCIVPHGRTGDIFHQPRLQGFYTFYSSSRILHNILLYFTPQ